jgi:hypothetical protein
VTTLIVLFKLQDESARARYERWARETDLPTVRQLPSVAEFEIFRVNGLFGSDTEAPYDYVEMIDIDSLDQFGTDVGTETMSKVAGEFREFADSPVFMLTNNMAQEMG